MIVAVQQPEHLPWLGFFDKLSRVDRFVLLDNVQFKKRYFENRNRIRTRDGSRWVTVPVRSKGRYVQRLDQVEIDQTTDWRRKYWGSIGHAYGAAPYFAAHAERFERLIATRWERLVDLNLALIEAVRGVLGIETPMTAASRLVDSGEKGSALILALCRALGARRYLSGPDGARYLDLESFERAGIAVDFHDYRHPEYPQLHAPFLSHMSVVDLIFNHGPGSLSILRNAA